MQTELTIDQIAENIGNDMDVKVTVKGDRAYIGRKLSKGFQTMGWIEVADDGEVEYELTRQKAAILKAAGL